MEQIDRAIELHQAGRLAEAEAIYRRALEADTRDFNAWHMLGIIHAQQQDFEAARELIGRALAIDNAAASCHHNYGNVLFKLARFREAIDSYNRALDLTPGDARIHADLGAAHKERGAIDQAIAHFAQAVALDPDLTDAHLDLGTCLLLRGEFAPAWQAFGDRRWAAVEAQARQGRGFSQPVWRGEEALRGRTILLHSAHGYGDAIQFCRLIPQVARLGATVVLEVQPALLHLLGAVEGAGRVLARGEPLPAFDVHCPLLSLPFALRTSRETIPSRVPYLQAEDALVARWRGRIGREGLKVGICWRGSNAEKSFPVALFREMSARPGVRLISLQSHAGSAESDQIPWDLKVETFGAELDAGPHAFRDTAAIMETLDLVITADTAIAHLAGGLGRPAWVALKHVPDWRWGMEGRLTPWYPTLRLFRQSVRGDWPSVFSQMAERLNRSSPGESYI